MNRQHLLLALFAMSLMLSKSMGQIKNANPQGYNSYPEVNVVKPDLPSPFEFLGREYVIAVTKAGEFAILDVTLGNDRAICQQMVFDTIDFPQLKQTGLHDEENLMGIATITGWTLDTINLLGLPGGLSHAGFMDYGEDIISVIAADNQVVKLLALTHQQMAKPLFHVLNMMDHDLALNRWNMAKHSWENIESFFYNGREVKVIAYDTKGGQKSIFNDGIQGAFHIKLWREPTETEKNYLKQHYQHLTKNEFKEFLELLSFINVGEMQPQYIMRYGFYEGHTFWRAEPLAIAFIFGLRPLEKMDSTFLHELDQKLKIAFEQ
jgi:hypothetical protein